MMDTPSVSTARLGYELHLSPRKLQWLAERKIVQPEKVGSVRRWGPGQTIEVAAVAAMRARGLSLNAVRKSLKALAKIKYMTIADIASGEDVYLVASIDGRATALTWTPEEVTKLAAEATRAVVVIRLGPELRRLWAPPRKIQ